MNFTRLAPLFAFAMTAVTCWSGDAVKAAETGKSPALREPRPISTETAAKLTAATPKYNPPPQAKPAEQLPDLREIDKPRNTIIRLPPFVVQESKPRNIPTKREVQTEKERREVVLNRYPGLKIGNFFGLNEGWAYVMAWEEERLEKKREYEDMVSLVRLGDPAMHAKVKKEVESAFQREPDFGR
jgi:hypothetical protein